MHAPAAVLACTKAAEAVRLVQTVHHQRPDQTEPMVMAFGEALAEGVEVPRSPQTQRGQTAETAAIPAAAEVAEVLALQPEAEAMEVMGVTG